MESGLMFALVPQLTKSFLFNYVSRRGVLHASNGSKFYAPPTA
jgi:hypothetical protein